MYRMNAHPPDQLFGLADETQSRVLIRAISGEKKGFKAEGIAEGI